MLGLPRPAGMSADIAMAEEDRLAQPAALPRRAVEADEPDGGVAAHYGQPMHEQRRLVDGSGWTNLSLRDVVRFTGPDRLAYLHAINT